MDIKNDLQNGITLVVLDFRKYALSINISLFGPLGGEDGF